MKLRTLVLVLIAGIAGIIIGWIFESSSTQEAAKPDLEIPQDIDYFLSSMSFQVFDQQGNLNYDMQSPYLEHFKQEDISRLQSPELHIYRAADNWQVKSQVGEVLHQMNWLKLNQDVVMIRKGDNPVQVKSQSILFKPDNDLVIMDDSIVIESRHSRIQAQKASFDLKANIFILQKTRAIYFNENS